MEVSHKRNDLKWMEKNKCCEEIYEKSFYLNNSKAIVCCCFDHHINSSIMHIHNEKSPGNGVGQTAYGRNVVAELKKEEKAEAESCQS